MTTVTINPSASNHDARQASGPVTLTGTLTIVGASQWLGLLLPAVAVPFGSNINSATLYYKATSTDHDDPAINWYAQNADTAAVFVTTDNDIVDRPRTTAFVADSASAIGTSAYRAINITPLIAAVTSRAGWASGNNIALIADGQTGVDLWMASYDTGSNIWYVEIDYTANQFTREIASSSDDGAETTGGSMVLSTTTMDCDGVGDIMGFMFRAVTVPVGSTVTTAYLKLYTNDSGRDSPNVTIKGQYAPAAFGTGSTNFSSRTMTTANVSWVATDIGIGAYKNSPDIASVLNEIVGNGGWTGSGDVAFFLIQNSSSGWLRVASFDHATDPAPQLYVEWSDTPSPISGAADATLGAVTTTAAGAVKVQGAAASTLGAVTTSSAAALTVSGAGAATLGAVTGAAAGVLPIKGAAGAAVGSFSLDIAAGGDDGQEAADGTVFLDGAYELIYTNRQVGYIFRNIDIPAGATITAAYINVVTFSFDDPNLTIRGEYAPADFTTASHDLSSRTKTTAGVAWIAANIGVDAYRASPDISAVLNEIVGAGGWASGDDLALYLIDNGAGGAFYPVSYENETYGPPQLVVEWTIAAPGNEIDAVTGSGAAALATHGAADATLGAVTGAAVGGVISGAAGAATLDAITGTAAATLLTHADADATLGAATSSAAGALAIVGAASATLDDATTSAAGVLALSGAADGTLGAVTSSGAAVLTIVGAGAVTLGDVTTAAQGELGLSPGQGASNVTLGAVTGEAAAMLLIAGAGAATLDEATAQGAAALLIAAAGSATLAAATATGAGKLAGRGQGTAALGAVTVAAVGVLPVGAAGDVAIGDILPTAAGALAIRGAAALALDAVTTAAAALLSTHGEAAAALDAITAEAAAHATAHGAGSAALGAVTVAGAAVLITHGTGAAAVTVIGQGAAALLIQAQGAAVLGAVTGAGSSTNAGGGRGDVALGAVTGSAAARLSLSGAGDATLADVAGAAVGRLAGVGSGAAALEAVTSSAVAALAIRGSGAAAVGAVEISGAGAVAIVAVGSAALGEVTAAGAAGFYIVGIGAATLGAITGEAVAHAALVSVFIGSVASPGKTGRVLYPRPSGSVRSVGNIKPR